MSSTPTQIITIFGGSGFIGRQLLRHLSRSPSASDIHIRLASRNPPSPLRLSHLAPNVAQISSVQCDIQKSDQVYDAVQGATHVVNCVGILFETPSKGITFRSVQQEAPVTIAGAIQTHAGHSVQRVVHLSAIGANKQSKSIYAVTKAEGEEAMLKLDPSQSHLTILRPSIVFGPEDSFFNRFHQLSNYMPFLPLVGGGTTKFQPVHVENVADAIVKALALDQTDSIQIPHATVFELGGADVLTFKQLMQMVLAASGRRRLLLPIPFPVANVQGTLFETLHSLAPSVPPLLTRDQVELLKSDNVVSPGAKTLADLGIEPIPCSLETISYLK